MASNERAGINFAQPTTFEQRVEVATACQGALKLNMPILVDTLDDEVELAYGAFPDRLYLIDPQGKVAFKSGRGPFGYEPDKLERALIMMLLEMQVDNPTGADAKSDTAEANKTPPAAAETASPKQASEKQASEKPGDEKPVDENAVDENTVDQPKADDEKQVDQKRGPEEQGSR